MNHQLCFSYLSDSELTSAASKGLQGCHLLIPLLGRFATVGYAVEGSVYILNTNR